MGLEGQQSAELPLLGAYEVCYRLQSATELVACRSTALKTSSLYDSSCFMCYGALSSHIHLLLGIESSP